MARMIKRGWHSNRRWRAPLDDPRWIVLRWPSKCDRCGCELSRDTMAFYYPLSKAKFCTGPDCGAMESRAFEAARADEELLRDRLDAVGGY